MADMHSSNATKLPARRVQRWAGIVLVLLALVLYLATLDTGFQPEELRGGDLITHQYAQVQARPSNAPGYPLYTMGGWLWFHGLRSISQLLGNPLPNPIPLLSSYSTLWALLSVWLLYAIICRLTHSQRWPAGYWPLAWLVGAFYAVTYFFWYYATTTEQYSSAIAQTLAIIYVYLLWRDAAEHELTIDDYQLSIVNCSPSPLALLFLLAFLCGLSLAHMLTVAFIVPPLVIVVLWQRPDLLRNVKAIVGSIAAAALPLLSYIFVYVRGAAHPEWWGEGDWANATEWFWAFVSTAQGREELGWGFEEGVTLFANGFPELIWQELSVPLLVLGLFGILLFDRKLMTLLYGAISITLLFSWAYRYGNWYQVILPIYPLILLGNVAIIDRWTNWWIQRQQAGRSRRWAATAAVTTPLLLLILAIIWRFTASLPAADSRNRVNDTALHRAALLLDQELAADDLFATVDDALAIQYLAAIWRIQPTVESISSQEAGDLLFAGQSILSTIDAAPILLSELPPALQPQMAMQSADWIGIQDRELISRDRAESTALQPLDADVGGEVELVAYSVKPAPAGGPVLDEANVAIDLTLVWHLLEERWPDGLALSIRPTSGGAFLPTPGGEPNAIIQRDVPQPTLLTVQPNPSSGDTLVDIQRIPFPAEADGIMVIGYRQNGDGFENLAEIQLPVEIDIQAYTE